MADLSKEEVRVLGQAAGLDLDDPDLSEVTHFLNALLDPLDQANPPGLDQVEPLPIPPQHG